MWVLLLSSLGRKSALLNALQVGHILAPLNGLWIGRMRGLLNCFRSGRSSVGSAKWCPDCELSVGSAGQFPD